MARKGVVVCVIAAAIVALLLAAVALRQVSVSAQPIAGATYSGTHSGGGTVSLTVSADGTEVTQLSYAISADTCAAAAALSGLALPIDDDHTFAYEDFFLSFSGSFPSRGTADGSITLKRLPPPCHSGTWAATAAVPSPTPTPTPTPSPTPSPSPSPTPTPTRAVNVPAHSWANFAWTGDGSSSPQEVANCYNDKKIAVMYRLDAETQVFERWIPGREELSTMADVAQFDALLVLNASDEPATCGMLDPSAVPARTLTIPASSWANFAWTGDSSPQEVANCYDEGKIAVMYRLDAETQVFERWIPGREEVSTMGDVAQFDALLVLNASDEPATCEMPGGGEAPATPTPSPTPTPTPTPTPGPVAGATYSGTTSDGKPILFTVYDDGESIRYVDLELEWRGWLCVEGPFNRVYFTFGWGAVPIEDGHFVASLSELDGSWSVDGTFTSPSGATGSLSAQSADRLCWSFASWTAEAE